MRRQSWLSLLFGRNSHGVLELGAHLHSQSKAVRVYTQASMKEPHRSTNQTLPEHRNILKYSLFLIPTSSYSDI